MAWFRCMVGAGNALELIVTCAAAFAGQTITCTDGTSTLTATCPSSSPYEITFKLPNYGTWTISGTISGTTYSETKTVLPYEAQLTNIPEGSTATPTDDIQTWLNCANIWDKSYTTISQVLADSATMTALIASNNAADYMARSTSWANSVTADSSAMTKIGANDYCADKLLADSTWLTSICNSTYFESVLNVKVPTMTSNTTPSGIAASSQLFDLNNEAFKSFANSSAQDHGCCILNGSSGYIEYKFTQKVKVNLVVMKENDNPTYIAVESLPKDMIFKVSDNGSTYTQVGTATNAQAVRGQQYQHAFINSTKAYYFRVEITNNHGVYYTQCGRPLQFYGRA